MTIYSDGACVGNPGPGGYGTILLLRDGTARRELSAGFRHTTNNRMELLGAIAGLEALTVPCEVVVHSDSRYLVDAMEKGWLRGWVRKGWVTSEKQPVKNQDLWRRVLQLVEVHTVAWRWVKGHAGHPENERCDALANAAARGRDLAIDEGGLP